MRSLDLIKSSSSKTKWLERITYFDDLITDYNKQVTENFSKQNKIDSLEEKIVILDSRANEMESNLKQTEKNYDEILKKYMNEKDKNKENLKEIRKLNKTIEFLKTNKRAPSLEELKDYQFKRKKSVSK